MTCPCRCHLPEFKGFVLVCRECGCFDGKHKDSWGSFEDHKVVHHTRELYQKTVGVDSQ
jgi:hypothetical protein